MIQSWLFKRRLPNQQAHFVSRTVMVKDNEVAYSMKLLNGIMSSEGLLQRWKMTRRFV